MLRSGRQVVASRERRGWAGRAAGEFEGVRTGLCYLWPGEALDIKLVKAHGVTGYSPPPTHAHSGGQRRRPRSLWGCQRPVWRGSMLQRVVVVRLGVSGRGVL